MIEYCGIKLKSPFVVASGPATNTVAKLRAAEASGAGGVSTKLTFYRRPFKSYARYYSEPKVGGIVSSDSRMEYKDTVELVKKAKNETGLAVLCNMTHLGEDTDGWVEMGQALEAAGADGLELNVNCPNITLSLQQLSGQQAGAYGAIAGQNPEYLHKIVSALKANVKIPVIPKLTYRVADISAMALVCKNAGADGVTLASGYPSLPPVDIYNKGRLYNQYHSGVSIGSLGGSRANLMHSFANVALVSKRTGLPIIGGGGIRTWEDGIQMMMWGAGLITACWVVMFEGFKAITSIVSGMDAFLAGQGYQSYRDIIGLALPNLLPGTDVVITPNFAQVDDAVCRRCHKCVGLGHCEAISAVEGKVNIERQLCTGCGVCQAICPAKAIRMTAADQA